jgi:OmpA-OmpF porin, OOP family
MRHSSSTKTSWLARALAATLAAACLGPVTAEETTGSAASTKLLTGRDVTEANLVDALSPEEPVLTRSLRVSRVARAKQPGNGSGGSTVAAKPSASLLITFETNSAVITQRARETLDVVASALQNERLAEYNFSVEGHADKRGGSDFNLALSQRRAESVREYLVGAHSIAPQRLTAIGKGDTDPLNKEVIAAPENRRVTIVTNVP